MPPHLTHKRFPITASLLLERLDRNTLLKLFTLSLKSFTLRETFLRIAQEAESIFLASIFAIQVGLSMREMSMMGMTQIGAQVIIIRQELYQLEHVQIKRFSNKDS